MKNCPGCHGTGMFTTRKRTVECVVCKGTGIPPEEYCAGGCGKHRWLSFGVLWWKTASNEVYCPECWELKDKD